MTIIISLLALAISPVPVSRSPVTGDAGTFFAPGRGYRATVEYETRLTDFVPFSRFELRDAGDRVIYSRPGDGLTVLTVGDNGAVVGAEFDGPVSGRARLRFFDAAGVEAGRADVGFYGERAFSADGSVFVVNDGRAGVRVFSAAGRELHNLGPAHRFAVAADGRLVALAQDDNLALYRDGVEQGRARLATPFVRELRFSGDGALVGWVERHGLRVLRTADLVEVLAWRPAATDPEPVSLDLSGPGGPVLVGLGKSHGRCAVLLLGAGGTELWRSDTTRERWNALTPRVRFGAGRDFSVETAEDIEVFSYEEE
jgi:hypothetical protein